MIILEQFVELLPLLVIGLMVFVIMLFIAWKRNHRFCFLILISGLSFALLSLWYMNCVKAVEITSLMRIDGYTILFTGLVLLASLEICIFSYPCVENYNNKREEFYLLILISTLGNIILLNSNHFTTLFLGIEISSLPLFALVGYPFYEKRSLETSIKYMILSSVALSFLLFGIALIYVQTGNLSFLILNNSLSNHMLHQSLFLIGFGLVIVGVGFKLSIVPFHFWTPDVYQGAPASISNFLATANKIAIFGAVIHLFTCVPLEGSGEIICVVLSIIAFFSIIFGNLMALSQVNIKRLLGCSSISHIGYLLVALVSLKNNQMLMEIFGVYLIGYTLCNLGAFGVVSLVSNFDSEQNRESVLFYHGLFWHDPILAMVMTVMMLSLAGIPITLGFIGKFYILTASIQASVWWLTVAIVFGSIIGLYYYLNLIVHLYWNVVPKINRSVMLFNWKYKGIKIVLIINTLLVIMLGIYPQPMITFVRHLISCV